MDKIQIVSLLITRKCNLKCSYCRISRNYKKFPQAYPNLKHYEQNEMKTEDVIEALRKIKLHNPNAFVIVYGGEPLLRPDLPDIINYCNREKINYTIISNNSDEVQSAIDDLLLKTEYVTGFTSSVDPIVVSNQSVNTDQYKKSIDALKRFTNLKKTIRDPVAEITVTNESIYFLYDLIERLTDLGINSDITVVDTAKSDFYDFSNVTDKNILVPKSQEVKDIFQKIKESKLDVHMKDILLDEIYEILPSDLDCEIEKDVHNITIDSDSSIRLCLRIRGVFTPDKYNTKNFILDDGNLHPGLKLSLARDKRMSCRKCNWTCMILSKLAEKNLDGLLHSDKREKTDDSL